MGAPGRLFRGLNTGSRAGHVTMLVAMKKTLSALLLLAFTCAVAATGRLPGPQADEAARQLALSIFKQLIEINTTDSVGSTTLAAEAMARRLREAGFPADDVVVLGPNERKNMV